MYLVSELHTNDNSHMLLNYFINMIWSTLCNESNVNININVSVYRPRHYYSHLSITS